RQFVTRGGFTDKAALIYWLHDTARMRGAPYWDLQIVQNYIYPRATAGEEPMASNLAAGPDAMIPMFRKADINVITVGGEANGYWQVMGARPMKTVSIDEWR